MPSNGFALVRAASDADDRLIRADEPLAGLQIRCGGDLPGMIAIPALLEIVRKARSYGMKLARTIRALDGEEHITAWVEVTPRSEGEPGCDISVHGWRTEPVTTAELEADDAYRREIDCRLANLWARLDSEQRLLAVEADAPDLTELASQMETGIGRPWTDFVSIDGDATEVGLLQ